MADPREITRALRGKWYGGYGLCFCPAHDNTRTPALTVATGRDGRLLLSCKAGCSFVDVLDALRGLGLVEGSGRMPEVDHAELVRRDAEAKARRDAGIAKASALWDSASLFKGSLAERYLLARAIRAEGQRALRFHPRCPLGRERRPAMVAAVVTEGEGITGVHRTCLSEPGIKAPDLGHSAKRMLGICAGGATRLLAGDGPLLVGEGIESSFSAGAHIASERPTVWAALSAPGMKTLRLPAVAGTLIIAPDAEPAGQAAASALAHRAHASGWTVELMPPPEGCGDWNDHAVSQGSQQSQGCCHA
ncbi:MAG: toprim domain-containing protein [Pseudomonadota bacterium]